MFPSFNIHLLVMTWYSERAPKARIFIFVHRIRIRLRANMDSGLKCVGGAATLPQHLPGAGPLTRLRWEDGLSRVLRERQRGHLMGMVFLRRALSWKLKPFEQTGTSPWETQAQFISPSPSSSLCSRLFQNILIVRGFLVNQAFYRSHFKVDEDLFVVAVVVKASPHLSWGTEGDMLCSFSGS